MAFATQPLSGIGNTLVAYGKCKLHGVTITHGVASGVVTVYDSNNGANGPNIAFDAAAPQTESILDAPMANGIFVAITGAASGCVISWGPPDDRPPA